ncbi:MAG: hypothetical protein C4523_07530 [Myxococcales bacterium]|nr:MAG: hypothetical protein C4523_07530 [Myxococcales bacterium]
MIRHPLLAAVLALDLVGLLLLAAAGYAAIRALLDWNPASSDRAQLRREREAEYSSLLARGGFWGLALGGALFVLAVALALPGLVPGAMCGVGVMEAMGGAGQRALAVRGLALLALWVWRVLDGLNRRSPRGALSTASLRFLLVALAPAFLAVYDTILAVVRLDVHAPVSCCTALYDRLRTATPGVLGGTSNDTGVLFAWIVIGATALAVAVIFSLRPPKRLAWPSLALAATMGAWSWLSLIAVQRIFASYHYGVLSHHCPWCLFLPEHYLIGVWLWGALVVGVLESVALIAAGRSADMQPELREAAAERFRRAARHVAMAVLFFSLLAAAPAVVWRIRFGMWME